MTEPHNEKISVIMAVYNCEETIKEAIDSIVNQTYTDWELVICNDCSTDGTWAIVESYRDKYPDKFILVQNDVNRKLAFSLNHCLEHATGYYVARMDGDDISLPERFSRQVEYLKQHPEVSLVGTAVQRFDETGLKNLQVLIEHPDRYSLHKSFPFAHATIMTYKSVYDKLNGYTVAKRTERGQDYDLWFRFFYEGFKGDNIQDALYLVREDANAIARRTFKVRWSVYPTTRMGFKLLGYPKRWLLSVFFYTTIKSITPFVLTEAFRKYQAKRKGH